MSDVVAKPSGPQWALANLDGEIFMWSVTGRHEFRDMSSAELIVPVRTIPGHGKVVPVELVEAINAAMGQFTERCGADAEEAVYNAIDKALAGAV